MKTHEELVARRQKLDENMELFQSIAKDNGYDVPIPPLTLKQMGRTGGRCGRRGIELSLPHLDEHEEEMSWHTLGHEFAHWIQRTCNLWTFTRTGKRRIHDARFKSLCRMLGVSDGRCHDMKLSSDSGIRRTSHRTMEAKCGCQTFQITPNMHRKIRFGSGHFCRTCKGTLQAL